MLCPVERYQDEKDPTPPPKSKGYKSCGDISTPITFKPAAQAPGRMGGMLREDGQSGRVGAGAGAPLGRDGYGPDPSEANLSGGPCPLSPRCSPTGRGSAACSVLRRPPARTR